MAQFTVRPAAAADARAMAELFAAVAEERNGIASEPPVDLMERTARFAAGIGESLVAVDGARVIGLIHVEVSRHGFGELGMLVDREWRGRGVGSALLQATIDWARDHGLHKLCLEVFKAADVEGGHTVVKQYRRANGELWDSLVMGLLL